MSSIHIEVQLNSKYIEGKTLSNKDNSLFKNAQIRDLLIKNEEVLITLSHE